MSPPVGWRTCETSGSAVSMSSFSGADGLNRMCCSLPARLASPLGVPFATTRPWLMTATRSHSRSASSMKWVTSKIVTPVDRIAEMSSQTSRRAFGSRPVDSSSSTATWGLPMRASATDRRCFWPPESLPKKASRRSARPGRVMSSSAGTGCR
jgi:hypothetical protein